MSDLLSTAVCSSTKSTLFLSVISGKPARSLFLRMQKSSANSALRARTCEFEGARVSEADRRVQFLFEVANGNVQGALALESIEGFQ
jgi:hypothetical protein